MNEHVLEEGMGIFFNIHDCQPLGVNYWDKFTLDTSVQGIIL